MAMLIDGWVVFSMITVGRRWSYRVAFAAALLGAGLWVLLACSNVRLLDTAALGVGVAVVAAFTCWSIARRLPYGRLRVVIVGRSHPSAERIYRTLAHDVTRVAATKDVVPDIVDVLLLNEPMFSGGKTFSSIWRRAWHGLRVLLLARRSSRCPKKHSMGDER